MANPTSYNIKMNNPTVRKLNRLDWNGWLPREGIFKLLGQSSGSVLAALRFLERYGLIETKHKRTEKQKAARCGRPKIFYRKLRNNEQ